MLYIVEEHNAQAQADRLRGMFQLRARVFRDRLNWDVTVVDGCERDDLDDAGPVYLIHTNPDGAVDASCRLLPTTGPTLIARFFSDTLPDAAYLSAPSIWECSRFCVDYDLFSRTDSQGAVDTCGSLVTQIGVLALRAGISTILGNFDAMMLRLYRRIGCEVEVLGCTHRFGRPVYLGAFAVSQAMVDYGRERFPDRAADAVRRREPLPA